MKQFAADAVTGEILGERDAPGTMYLIASLKHTTKDKHHIVFWGPNHRGYRIAIRPDTIGRYTLADVERDPSLNDGVDCLAVPEWAIASILKPRPYFRRHDGQAAPFYDNDGPVVDNDVASWKVLFAAALPGTRYTKPEVFKGKRRTFSLPGAIA